MVENAEKVVDKKLKQQVSLKEKLNTLLKREKRLSDAIEVSKAKLQETKKEIKNLQTKIAGIEFLNMKPNEFLVMSQNLGRQDMLVGDILKMAAGGDFKKLQEIYISMQDVK